MPPLSGLMIIAERRRTLRVRGVSASSAACSQAFATSTLNLHVEGTPGSDPPRIPVASSFAASKRCA